MFDSIKATARMCNWDIDEIRNREDSFFIGSPYSEVWDYRIIYSKADKCFRLKKSGEVSYEVIYETLSIGEFEKYVFNLMAEAERKGEE